MADKFHANLGAAAFANIRWGCNARATPTLPRNEPIHAGKSEGLGVVGGPIQKAVYPLLPIREVDPRAADAKVGKPES